MKRLLVLGALVLAGTMGNAEAATITFNELPFDIPGTGGDRTSGGFLFDTLANHSHILDASFDNIVDNGSLYMGIDDVLGLNPVTFSAVGGAPFAFKSIDIAEWDNVAVNPHAGNWSRKIDVLGNVVGGGTVSATLTLDGIFDGVGGAVDFQTFAFDESWGNLSSVVLKGMNSQPQDGNYYAIDNVVVDAPVPEPGTLSLLGLGSAYLFKRRRSNRNLRTMNT